MTGIEKRGGIRKKDWTMKRDIESYKHEKGEIGRVTGEARKDKQGRVV